MRCLSRAVWWGAFLVWGRARAWWGAGLKLGINTAALGVRLGPSQVALERKCVLAEAAKSLNARAWIGYGCKTEGDIA